MKNVLTCITYRVSAMEIVGCCCGIAASLPASQNSTWQSIWNTTLSSEGDCSIATSERRTWRNNGVGEGDVLAAVQCSAGRNICRLSRTGIGLANFEPWWFLLPSKCTTRFTGRSGQPCTNSWMAATTARNSASHSVRGRYRQHHRRCAF
jgi:hypothetical protein